jgi:hypothetical protein
MIVFIMLSGWLLFLRKDKPVGEEPPPANAVAASASLSPRQAMVCSAPALDTAGQREAMAEVQGRQAPFVLEGIGILPREVAPEPELVPLQPREVEARPALVAAAPRSPEPAPAGVNAVALEPPEIAIPVKVGNCNQFGTKVDFLMLPSKAFEMASKDKDKLVMVLHIAGNFEDRGFT